MLWGETTSTNASPRCTRRWRPGSPCSTSRRAMATARPKRSSARRSAAAARRRAGHQQVQSRQSAARRDRGDPAPLDRGQPAAAAPVAARPVLPALKRGAGRERSGAAGARPQPDDALRDLRRAVRPVFERLVAEGLIGAWGLTGIGHPDTIIRLLGERPAPAAVQCIANLLDSPGGAEVLRRPGEAARDHGGGARQRGRRDGHPRGAGRGADRGDRPAAAGRSSRDARLCARGRVPPALRRAGRGPGGDRAPLRAVARHRHAGARREEPPGTRGAWPQPKRVRCRRS